MMMVMTIMMIMMLMMIVIIAVNGTILQLGPSDLVWK